MYDVVCQCCVLAALPLPSPPPHREHATPGTRTQSLSLWAGEAGRLCVGLGRAPHPTHGHYNWTLRCSHTKHWLASTPQLDGLIRSSGCAMGAVATQ